MCGRVERHKRTGQPMNVAATTATTTATTTTVMTITKRRKSHKSQISTPTNSILMKKKKTTTSWSLPMTTLMQRSGPKSALSWLGLLTLLLLLLATRNTECRQDEFGHPSISQISPKSASYLIHEDAPFLHTTANMRLESTIADTSNNNVDQSSLTTGDDTLSRDDNETRQHLRVERSALPILTDNYPKSGPNDVHFPSDTEKEAGAGRYFQYNIKPTGTLNEASSEAPERTQRARAGKTFKPSFTGIATATMAADETSSSESFLAKGGLRPLTSGSPIIPTRSFATSTAVSATVTPHNPRQNSNPDIQDIITGIVKLLNGNVNVHANTQGLRRPSASRINNRGPPRISDVQNLPIDYETQKKPLGSSIRPPPYTGPFDRPERPFITGVPIPEQIVPLRPGFISQRPPWHRQKPRPPITTAIGGRRPIPQYKPLPNSQLSPPAAEESAAPVKETLEAPTQPHSGETEISLPPDYNDANGDIPKPTDATYDSEFSNEDTNSQYIEVSDQDSNETADTAPLVGENSEMEEDELTSMQVSPPPVKKDEQSTKKKPVKHKTTDKKKHTQEDYTTIINTSSVVHTEMQMSSTYAPMPMPHGEGVNLDPSTEEVIFMTPSKTPSLEINSKNAETSSVSLIETQSSIVNTPLTTIAQSTVATPSPPSRTELLATIPPDPTNITPKPPSTTTTTTTKLFTTTSTTTTTAPISVAPPASTSTNDIPATVSQPPNDYQPRPGIVLDDPEFKPGGRPRPPRPHSPRPVDGQQQPPVHIQPTRQHLPPGYGEIFDVTLSAIQGPGSVGGSQQTINIKPYGSYGNSGGQQADIIVSAAGDDGFVSIDGKRTYINLFGDPTDPPVGVPTTPATAIPQLPGSGVTLGSGAGGGGGSGIGSSGNGGTGGSNVVTQNNLSSLGAGYGVPETEIVDLEPTKSQSAKPQSPTTIAGPTRPHYRSRPTQPPVRIDTCIVGDDSTCDQAQHERCKTDNGVSSCHCRPGYSRRKHREPCRKVISFYLGMRVDRIYEHRIVWDNKLLDKHSEPYGQLSYESIRAIDSAMSMTPYSDEFMDARVNNIYRGDPNLGGSGVFVNMTIKLDESVETLRPNLRADVQKHLLGVLHRRNNNIGNSVLYVTSPEGSITALHDLDECQSRELNDCHASASCSNSWGTFRCTCETGLRDPWADQPQRAGRDCQSCPDTYCNSRGTCSYNDEGNQVCACDSSHYGGQCEIDGEVLGVAIGASLAAVIIIVLTLVCLIMWSRRWQREQKNAIGSPVFGYMNTAPMKSAGLPGQAGYQVTLEDRMRWAQIADVMAQTNHYGVSPIAEPVGPTRPSSAMFAYPNLQSMGMGTMGGGMSMQGTMQMHQAGSMAPPVPLPRYERLGLSSRSNGMRTLENSSSSEEEDRTDLLGRNFQVPRPKSRSNGSIANQSGIYYDVDYEPSGNGIGNTSVDHLYGSQNQSSSHSHTHSHTHSGNNHIPGPQGIPMSTYTSGRAPSSYYMK
ncbi:mucin-5AC isoform X4 [Ceratitis capitata]|uniref:mucin-5AC isoform X4 n=1 Tax=Ceratitis capitata TaxID=7213 RepID=UPI0006188ED3|nr:mucin-5AC isoform X4 [Ceratitis capitata]